MVLATILPDQLNTLALVIFGLLLYAIWSTIYGVYLHPLADVPGPISAKVFPFWTIKILYQADLCPALAKLHQHYGPVVRTGPNELSFISPEAHDTIYRVPFTKSKTGHYFSKDGTLQDGIANLIFRAPTIGNEGDRIMHRRLRNRMASAFTTSAVLSQQEVHQVHLTRMFAEIDKACTKGEKVDLRDHFSILLWNLVSDLSFGEPLVSSKREKFISMEVMYRKLFPFLEAVNCLFPWLERALFKISRYVPASSARAFLPTGQLRQCMDRQDNRKDFLTAIMGENEKDTGAKGKDGPGLLSWDALYSNASFFIVSGYFTNEISHCALMYNLLRSEKHMEELQRELRAAFKVSEDITAERCARLPFLNACINESLRMWPPLAGKFMSRRSPGAMIDGVWVPFGTQVYVDPYAVQRSPNAFVDPDEFRPERFLDHAKGSRYQYDRHDVFKPFSSGPRTCIGREMALQSLRLTIATLLFRYDIKFTSLDCFVWERDSKSSALWAGYRLPVQVTASSQ